MLDTPTDLADKMADDLGQPMPPDGEPGLVGEEESIPSVVAQMGLALHGEDRMLLDRIKAAAQEVCDHMFSEAKTEIDSLYLRMRIPALNEDNMIQHANGRIVWQVNESGRYVEDLDQLTGQDYDSTILNLQRLVLDIAPQVNEMCLDAIYAQHYLTRDSFDDAWLNAKAGALVGDKRAKSNKESRQSRYQSFFLYYVYSMSKTYLDEIKAFIRHIDNVRYRQMNSR